MSFLHGVLGNIQPKLGLHKDEINNAITSLNLHKHSGKEGFNAAIVKVAEGVNRYNEGVRASNKKVGEEFKKKVSDVLKNDVVAGDANKKIQEAKWHVDKRLEECQSHVKTFNETLNVDKHTDIKQAINDLNPTLALRVNNALKAVSHESDRLKALSDKQKNDLQATTEKITEVMKEHGKEVNCKVTEQVRVLVDYLKGKVEEILKMLEGINKRLQDYVAELGRWFEKANDAIKVAEKKVEAILNQVNGSSKNAFETAATLVQSAAEQMGEAVEQAKKKVAEDVAAALKEVKDVNDYLRYDLTDVKLQVLTGIRTYVKNNLLETINKEVVAIKGKNVMGEKKGLEGIESGVKEYVNAYGDGFEKTVAEWIKDMLGRKPVSFNITSYLGGDTNRFKPEHRDGKTLEEEVKKTISTQISKELVKNVTPMDKSKTTVHENLDAVKTFLTTFASHVDSKFDSISEIVGTIQTTLLTNPDASPNHKSEIDKALRVILPAVAAAARQAAKMLESVALDKTVGTNKTSIAQELDTAHQNTNALVQKLLQVIKQQIAGAGVTDPYDVIGQINSVLNGNIGQDDNTRGATKITLSRLFTNYSQRIKLTVDTKQKLDGAEDESEGTLPKAIGDIHRELTKALLPIDQAYATLFLQVSDINSSVSQLCHAINEAAGRDPKDPQYKDSIKKRLSDLKALINDDVATINGKKHKGLSKIHAELSELRSSLMNGPIKKAQDFIRKEVSTIKLQTLTCIHKYVDQKVTEAENALTAQAQKQYVTSIQAMLKAFCDKVEKDLHGLPEEIAADLEKGHKKFMKLFEDNFVNEVKGIESIIPKSASETESPVSKAANIFKAGFTELFKIFKGNADFKSDYGVIRPSNEGLFKVLNSIIGSLHFNRDLADGLDFFRNKLSTLNPKTFGDGDHPWLLESFRKGFSSLVSELQKAYVSTYSQQKINWDKSKDEEKEKYAKICLTLTPILYQELGELQKGLENGWENYKIYNSSNSNHSLHKLFFSDNGYDVGRPAASPHGELNHRKDFNGDDILTHLNKDTYKLFHTTTQSLPSLSLRSGDQDIPVEQDEEDGVIHTLRDYLNKYFGVCHLYHIDKPRSPCSIYDMSLWLSGLPHNPVYGKLKQQIKTMFEVPDENNPSNKIVKPMNAYPKPFSHEHIHEALKEVTAHAYSLLTGVLGHGDAETFYACDFPTNSLSLKYPSSGAECLDMLLDILRRMFPVLTFLHTKCGLRDKHGGWRDCYYGKYIRSTKFSCNEHVTDKPTCQPNCQANSKANCQPTSPLMSYLNDSLHGHLPHDVTSVGCKSSCNTCPKSPPGMPCLPPLGFRAFSNSTHKGKDLCEVLTKFFDNGKLNTLFNLVPKAPSTLPEHLGFVLSLVNGWAGSAEKHRKTGLQNEIEKKIMDVSIELYKKPVDLTDALRNAYGSSQSGHDAKKHLPAHADVSSVAMTTVCREKKVKLHCAPYMSSLCGGYYTCLPFKHSSTYLSWAIYLPWTFWDLLNNLYNAFCGITCADWGCRGCLRGDKCKSGKHGVVEDEKKADVTCQCTSIVACRGVAPTLYQYGFSFGEASTLNSGSSAKKCKDFCSQLRKVLHSDYFEKLFEECDNFLKEIRWPFMLTLLALWSLSLLYLAHIAVVRLDVLRIRSHLRSPSSHRIAAQSLLAAARVKALANVKYFSP
ncbi:hypothetical protein, conserved [Babesia ovata]|uniref:C3H1-type domain-containing protein n=1 Tax=Babesia ovata TaxID=189622 RepID=A0A2H6KIT9_9APIC|nr:uncharacterized protein BOVATA_044060 [Babesia ovata]GBE62913.1 hypothetical protein, conserved [Babesia ovata]